MSVLSLDPEDKRKDQRNSLESVYSSSSRLNLLTKRKRMNSIVNMNQQVRGDRYVTQRVLSAKTHRVKQLQNQLADAHYHLQELSNENRALRALQKKQEIALQRYENSNAELPQVLNSHNEEIRIQQSKYKLLRQQYKEVSQKLKERDMQLQQLRDEHVHLLELSKDKNLYEREKLQAQLAEMNVKVQNQTETINLLQRRLTLEAKNFKHQLQAEINKHKDTRNDLDMAITNADKLSTIIEMKEKMLSTAACRGIKSPTKVPSVMNLTKSTIKLSKESSSRVTGDKIEIDNSILGKLCESSRNVSSALSNEETSSSSEPRSRHNTSRTSSSSRSTPKPSMKYNKDSDELIDLAKTVQDGMADLTIDDEDLKLRNSTTEDMKKKMDVMKENLMKKIKHSEEPVSRLTSALRRKSTEESIEEQSDEEVEIERPKSKDRRNSVYFDNCSQRAASAIIFGANNDVAKTIVKRENSLVEKKISSKPIDKYCKDIIQDIEKSSKVIDGHIKQFGHSKQASDKLVEQLQAVDKLNDFVNGKGDMSDDSLIELNNNFHIFSDRGFDAPIPRKRTISGRRSSRMESTNSILGDANLTNQDLLNDLLGHI